MYLFLFFALPLFYYIFTTLKSLQKVNQENQTSESAKFSKGFLLLVGIIIAIIYCFVDFFTAYAYRTPVYSAFSNFPYYFLSIIFVPTLICAVILLLLSKDSWIFKLQTFIPMLIGFYTIFLPYETISKNDTFDFFLLFVVPILFSSMIFLLDFALDLLISVVNKNIKKIAIIISILLIIVAIFLPAIIYSMYYTKTLLVLVALLSLFFVTGTVTLHIFSNKIQSKLR